MKSYWRCDELAKMLGVHLRTIHRWIKTGKLPCHQIGRKYRIEKENFEKWMDGNIVEPKKDGGK